MLQNLRSKQEDLQQKIGPTSQWLGTTDYLNALTIQTQAAHDIQLSNRRGVVFGLEHPAVITLGKRAAASIDLQGSAEDLKRHGVELCSVDRGGQATLHSPGQLVIYPVLPLLRMGLGARAYVEGLQEASLRFLKTLGIKAVRSCEGPGLYTESGKIAFFGVRISRGVSLHGLSINVHNDLKLFRFIRSCGRSAESFDLLSRYVPNAALEPLFHLWIESFHLTFGLTSSPSEFTL